GALCNASVGASRLFCPHSLALSARPGPPRWRPPSVLARLAIASACPHGTGAAPLDNRNSASDATLHPSRQPLALCLQNVLVPVSSAPSPLSPPASRTPRRAVRPGPSQPVPARPNRSRPLPAAPGRSRPLPAPPGHPPHSPSPHPSPHA